MKSLPPSLVVKKKALLTTHLVFHPRLPHITYTLLCPRLSSAWYPLKPVLTILSQVPRLPSKLILPCQQRKRKTSLIRKIVLPRHPHLSSLTLTLPRRAPPSNTVTTLTNSTSSATRTVTSGTPRLRYFSIPS